LTYEVHFDREQSHRNFINLLNDSIANNPNTKMLKRNGFKFSYAMMDEDDVTLSSSEDTFGWQNSMHQSNHDSAKSNKKIESPLKSNSSSSDGENDIQCETKGEKIKKSPSKKKKKKKKSKVGDSVTKKSSHRSKKKNASTDQSGSKTELTARKNKKKTKSLKRSSSSKKKRKMLQIDLDGTVKPRSLIDIIMESPIAKVKRRIGQMPSDRKMIQIDLDGTVKPRSLVDIIMESPIAKAKRRIEQMPSPDTTAAETMSVSTVSSVTEDDSINCSWWQIKDVPLGVAPKTTIFHFARESCWSHRVLLLALFLLLFGEPTCMTA